MKSTYTKNKRSSRINAVLAMTLAGSLFCGTALASSKSATIQVSCTIKPMIEMAGSSSVKARSNMGKERFQMSECLMDRGSQKTKLYSLTAL